VRPGKKGGTAVRHRTIDVGGLATHYIEAGAGEPLVLLHGGEFGASAELGWERVIGLLAARYHVVAPDLLGFGDSAKVVDFVDGRGLRIRHIARLCGLLGIASAHFAGNSMGAVMLLADAASPDPVLPAKSLVAICGGGEILANEHVSALYDYDGTLPAMGRLVAALFHDRSYPDDEAYVRRRWESSIAPGAWEAVAAARFRRPGRPPSTARSDPRYERIGVPALLIEGGCDKLKPAGWADDIARQLPDGRAVTVDQAGHCPQIERPDVVADLVLGFLATHHGGRANDHR
jgi:pimeloyl-ACP methyl ester carboxylesterase